ncbi:MAG: hypothetical protein HY320_14945 [Armatimonadetes bacterium]|nr:hypothetical protein [Armatimonadota bacterium]
MAVTVETVLDEHIARYVDHLRQQRHAADTDVVRELIEGGYDQVVRQLHARCQRGEITLRSMAAELGLSLRELYALLEQKDLPV